MTMNNFCGNCGCKLQTDAKFCPDCGQKIELPKKEVQKSQNAMKIGKDKKKMDERKRKCKKHYSKKAIALTTCFAVVCMSAGAYTASIQDGNPLDVENITTAVRNTIGKKDLDKLIEVYNSVNITYIANMVSYLPEYDSISEISSSDIKNIYSDAFKYYYTQYGNCDLSDDVQWDDCSDRIIIVSNSCKSEEGKEWVFDKDTFEQFNTIAGIKFNKNNLDSSFIKDNGKEYVVNFDTNISNSVYCKAIGIVIDKNSQEVIVNIVKSENDGEVKKEHVVIVPADNLYGYKIKQIKGGHVKKKHDIDMLKNTGKRYAYIPIDIADALKDYNAEETHSKEEMEKIAVAGTRYVNQIYGLNSSSGTEKVEIERNKFDEFCEYMGIPKNQRNIEINSDSVYLDKYDYKVQADQINNTVHTDNILLRTEVKNKQVIVQSLENELGSEGEACNYKKVSVMLEPAENIWGYSIKEISMEKWDDKYAKDISELDQTVHEKLKAVEKEYIADQYDDYSDNNDTEEDVKIRTQKENARLWYEKMYEIKEEIEKKYPDKKEFMEKYAKLHWKDDIQRLKGDSSYDELTSTINSMRAHCYFMIGNCLMSDNIDELENYYK